MRKKRFRGSLRKPFSNHEELRGVRQKDARASGERSSQDSVALAVSVALDVSHDLRRSVQACSAWKALAPLVFAAKLGVPLRVRVTMVRCPGSGGPLIILTLPL